MHIKMGGKKHIMLLFWNRPFYLIKVLYTAGGLKFINMPVTCPFLFIKCWTLVVSYFLKSVLLTSSFQSYAHFWLGWWQEQHVPACCTVLELFFSTKCCSIVCRRGMCAQLPCKQWAFCVPFWPVNKCGLGIFYVKRGVGLFNSLAVCVQWSTVWPFMVVSWPNHWWMLPWKHNTASLFMLSCWGTD